MPTEAELQAIGVYVSNYLAATDVLVKEQAYLTGIAGSILGSQQDRFAAAAAAATIGVKLIELSSAHELYMKKLSKVAGAPSAAQVQTSTDLTRNLAEVIRNAVRASIIVDAVTKFVADWTKLTPS